jgi:hypothetical protein
MKPAPNEIRLTGKWITENGKTHGDDISERIYHLIKHYLENVAVSEESGGWDILYKDPGDGRYWECSYPHSELHGGGPPQLTVLTVEQVKTKYRI